jgi:hypothetical protein
LRVPAPLAPLLIQLLVLLGAAIITIT